MGLRDRLPRTEETPHHASPDNPDSKAVEKRNRSSQPSHPRRRATDFARPEAGNLLEMASKESSAPAGDILAGGPIIEDEARDDHILAALLPPEQSAIDAEGHMDHHRKLIISIHGKDIDEHELGKNVA